MGNPRVIGCRCYEEGRKVYPFSCPLHKAANELLAACKAALMTCLDDELYDRTREIRATLEAAISRAGRK